MDKAAVRAFRSDLTGGLMTTITGLIEDEANMRMALGRLWQAMSEDPDKQPGDSSVVPKREDEDHAPDNQGDRDSRFARAPDLTPIVDKLFLLSYPNGGPPVFEPSHFASPEMQIDNLEKSLAALRDLQDDGREYVERLQEIREGLGDVRAQREGLWKFVREGAIAELHEEAILAST